MSGHSKFANIKHKKEKNDAAKGKVFTIIEELGPMIFAYEDCVMDADDLMMIALDAGAEDFNEEEDSFEILTSPEEFTAVREALEKENIPMAEADVTMIPQNYVELTSEDDIKKMNRILDMLEMDDDVQDVYHNWDE